MKIAKPVTPDKLCGYDDQGNFWIGTAGIDHADSFTIYEPGYNTLDGRACPFCGNGWVATTESLNNQIFLRESRSVAHQDCFRRFTAYQQRCKFIALLAKAGFYKDDGRRIFEPTLAEIPNEYWRADDRAYAVPWYVFSLDDVKIKIGRRKRVDEITLITDRAIDKVCLAEDLKGLSDSTHAFEANEYYHHSWNDEQTVIIIQAMLKAIDWNRDVKRDRLQQGDKVRRLSDGKIYDFGYYTSNSSAVLYEQGERNAQDSFAVQLGDITPC